MHIQYHNLWWLITLCLSSLIRQIFGYYWSNNIEHLRSLSVFFIVNGDGWTMYSITYLKHSLVRSFWHKPAAYAYYVSLLCCIGSTGHSLSTYKRLHARWYPIMRILALLGYVWNHTWFRDWQWKSESNLSALFIHDICDVFR